MDENLGHTRRNARVVVVEDDDALEDLIMAWLARHGLQTVPIRGGTPARQRFRRPLTRNTLHGLRVDHVVDLPPDLATVEPRVSRVGNPTVVIVSGDGIDPDDMSLTESSIEVLRASESSNLGEWVDAFRLKGRKPRQGHIRVGPVDIDPARRTVQINGQEIRLTPTEFRLFNYLAENANRVVGHAELLGSVWSPGYEDDLHLLQETIRSLRARIALATHDQIIESVYGAGYRMARYNDSGAIEIPPNGHPDGHDHTGLEVGADYRAPRPVSVKGR